MRAQASLNVMDYSLFGTAIDGLSAKQVALALSTQNLSQAQLEEIVIKNDLLAKYGAEELIKNGLLSANSSLLASEKAVSAEKLQEAIIENALNKEKAEGFIQTHLETVADGEEVASTAILNKALMDEMVKREILLEEKANEILQSFGIVSGDVAETASKSALTKATWELVKAQAAQIATSPVGMIALAIGAGLGLMAIYDGLTTSLSEAQENLEDSISTFNETTDEINSLNEELNTTVERIKELQKLSDSGEISVADEAELELLKEQNKELARQIALKQRQQITEGKKALEDAKEVSTKTVKSEYEFVVQSHKEGTTTGAQVSVEKELQLAMDAYDEAQVKYDKWSKELEKDDLSDRALREAQVNFNSAESQLKKSESRIDKMYNILATERQAYLDLVEAGYSLDGDAKQRLDELNAIDDIYLLWNHTLTQTKESFTSLNAEQQRSILLNRLLKQGLSETDAKSVLSNISDTDLAEYWDKDFSFIPPVLTDYTSAEKYGKAYAEAWINGVKTETQNSDDKDVSFLEIFNSSDFTEHKEELLELACAGELTSETLTSTEEYKTLLDKTGLSAENVKDRIYDVLTAQEKLAGANNGIDNLKSSYEEFKDLGFVTAQTLEDLPDVFKSLEGYDIFSQIVGNPESGVEAIQQAFNDIVTEYLMFTQTLNSDSLISDNVEEQQRAIQTYIANLKEMGITNAEEVVSSAVKSAKQQKELIEKAEEEYVNYLETKDENDLKYIESTASYNSQLINSLGEGYATDYQNWLSLLEDKELAYNRFVNSLTGDNGFNYDPTKSITDNLLANGKDLSAYSIVEAETAKAEYERIQKKYNELRDSISFKGAKFESNLDLDYDGSSGSSSSSETFLDGIEIQIDNINDELDDLQEKIDNTYSSWTDRQNKLTEASKTTASAIEIQNKALKAYETEASKIGLPQSIKDLIDNGNWDIKNGAYTGETADKIKEYQELADKIKECEKAINDLTNTQNELAYAEKWDLFKSKSDLQIEGADNIIDYQQSLVDKAELQGLFANEDYYKVMRMQNLRKQSELKKQYAELETILNTVPKGTEAYDTLFNEWMDIRNQLGELENEFIEFNNNIRDLDWEIFEYLEDSISRITEEVDFLKDLLSDEDMFDEYGNMTKYADATMGLHFTNIETYKKLAEDYYGKMQELQQQLADGAGQDVLEKYREYEDLHRDAITSIMDEKNAILDLVQNAYDEQINALERINDLTLERMDRERDLYNYQKNITEKMKEKTSLERQISVYNGDNSEESIANTQRLKLELEKVNSDIEELQYEKQRADTEQMLTSITDSMKEWQSKRMDDEQGLLEEIKEGISTKSDEIKTTLTEVAGEYGTTLSTSLSDIFDSKDPFGTVVTAINNLVDKITSLVGDSNSDESSNTPADNPKPNTNTDVKQPTTNSKQPSQPIDTQSKSETDSIFISQKSVYPKGELNKDKSATDWLKYHDYASDFQSRAIYYKKLGGSGAYTGSGTQNSWLLKKMKEVGYASGTNYAKAGLHWTQENGDELIIRKSDGALLTPLSMGDKVVNADGTSNLFTFANDPQGFLEKFGVLNYAMPAVNVKMPDTSVLTRRNATNGATIGNVNIEVGQVVANDPMEFAKQMRLTLANDRNTQKMVQELGLGQSLGHNSMNVKRYL